MSTAPASGRPLVSVLIVNTNDRRYLDGVLTSVFAQDYDPLEVIVVDNDSSDGSVEFVRTNFPNVTVVENRCNLGFGGANNAGMGVARGGYIFLLNPDTVMAPDALSAVVEVMERHPRVGAAQSKLLRGFHGTVIDSAGSYLTASGFLYHHGYGDADGPAYARSYEIFSAKGAGLMLRRAVIDRVGLFDEDFFLFFEETDLCWRIWLAGYSVLYVPESIVHHDVGGSTRLLPAAFLEYESFKNRICSLIKNLGTLRLLRVMPLHLLMCFGAAAAYTVRGHPGEGLAIVRAVGWNLRHLPRTLQKRRPIQQQRRLSDRELWPRIARHRSWGDTYAWLRETRLK